MRRRNTGRKRKKNGGDREVRLQAAGPTVDDEIQVVNMEAAVSGSEARGG